MKTFVASLAAFTILFGGVVAYCQTPLDAPGEKKVTVASEIERGRSLWARRQVAVAMRRKRRRWNQLPRTCMGGSWPGRPCGGTEVRVHGLKNCWARSRPASQKFPPRSNQRWR